MLAKIYLSAVFGVLLAPSAYACCDPENIASQFEVEVTISVPLSIDEVEKIEREEKGLNQTSAPFARLTPQWESLKKEWRDGDCIVHFKTSDETWQEFAGREGYLLVRDGEILVSIVTRLN